MIERVAVARADEGDFVGLGGDAGEQFGDFHTGPAVALELPGTAPHGRLGEIDAVGLEALGHLRRDGLAAVFGELGLGIEGVHVADAAVHEQVDDGFGARRKMRRFGGQRIVRAGGFEHSGQGQSAESASGLDQQFASRIMFHGTQST